MRRPGSRLTALAVLAALAGSGAPASARSEKTLAYPRDQAWPAAVRFLAVDERLRVLEKDADAGYALFELRDEGKLFRGALEVISLVEGGRPVVRFVLAIEDRPSWLEAAMLGRLERKLRIELGSPAPALAPKPKDGPGAPPKDAPAAPRPPPPADGGGPPISPTP
jgi:hypothetical protein